MTNENKKVETMLHEKLSDEQIVMLAVETYAIFIGANADSERRGVPIREETKQILAITSSIAMTLHKTGYDFNEMRLICEKASHFIAENKEEIISGALKEESDSEKGDGTA